MRTRVFATLPLALLTIVGCSEASAPPLNLAIRTSDAFARHLHDEVYVAAKSANLVLRYDAMTFAQNEPPLVGLASPEGVGLALDGVAETAYVSNDATGTVGVFAIDGDTTTRLATITGVFGASGVAVDDRACKLFVTGYGSVHVFDTSTLAFRPLTTLSTAQKIVNPGGLAVDSAHARLFVAQGTGTVEVFDTHHLDRAPQTISGLNSPGGVAVDPRSQRIFVTENDIGDVKSFAQSVAGYTFDSVVASGLREPFGDAYDPETGRLFVVQFGSSDVVAFDGVSHRFVGGFVNVPGPWAVAVLNDNRSSFQPLSLPAASAHRCAPTN